jgi:hypothetical protein
VLPDRFLRDELFAGNPAGIRLVPTFPANDVTQKIAAEKSELPIDGTREPA